EKPSRAQAAFDKIWKEIRSRPRKFEPKDGPRILAGLYRSRLPEADNRKLMEHAKNNPKDPSAAEALMMVGLFNNADTSKDGARHLDRNGAPKSAKKVLETARAAEQAIPEYRAKLEGELKGVLADVSVGAKAPPTEVVDFKGKPVKLSDFKGKVVVLQFWIS